MSEDPPSAPVAEEPPAPQEESHRGEIQQEEIKETLKEIISEIEEAVIQEVDQVSNCKLQNYIEKYFIEQNKTNLKKSSSCKLKML